MKLLVFSLLVLLFACKGGPSDEQLQKDVANSVSAASPGITASVNEGVVTLTGSCPDEPCKSSSESAAKNVKGVKSVVNNIVINAPAAPEITADDSLQSSVNNVVKSYKNVNAKVEDGVVTLTGEIKRSQLTPLMQNINELKPKRVVNNLTIK